MKQKDTNNDVKQAKIIVQNPNTESAFLQLFYSLKFVISSDPSFAKLLLLYYSTLS